MNRPSSTLGCALALALTAACANSSTGGPTPDGGFPPDFTGTSTPDGCQPDPAGYPAGPYGTKPGDTIANLTLRVQTGAGGTPALRSLNDYRSCGLKVLAIAGAAEWCVPCKQEQPDLQKTFTDYQTKSVAVLVAVTQKNDQSPSDDTTVKNWARTFGLTFDIASDPGNALGPYFDPMTFPDTMVLRLRDMTIQDYWIGNQPGKLKAAIDAALQ